MYSLPVAVLKPSEFGKWERRGLPRVSWSTLDVHVGWEGINLR